MNSYNFIVVHFRQLTWLLTVGTLPELSKSTKDAEELFVLVAAASNVSWSWGLTDKESTVIWFVAVGDIRGALNFLFASRDAKPLKAKENLIKVE